MINLAHCERGVDGNVEAGGGVLILAVKVAALRRLTDAVEAVDLQVRCEREAGFERIDPLARVALVVLDFGGGVRHAVRVVFQHLGLVPCVAVL